jgi:tripartite ATP-independent transporter DctM subunit
MGRLFGTIRGGLGYSVIIVGFILGAITGTVAAQVIAMALISLPVMMRYKYDIRYATGVLAASGTITQLVPPSLVLIVLADQLGKSVGDMYLGAWGPSLMQVTLFAAYTFLLSRIRPDALPAIPKSDLTESRAALVRRCLAGIIPSAVLIFLVLGTMMMGLATPTEAGAMGAVGAVVLAVLHHKDLGRTGSIAFATGLIAAGIAVVMITSWSFSASANCVTSGTIVRADSGTFCERSGNCGVRSFSTSWGMDRRSTSAWKSPVRFSGSATTDSGIASLVRFIQISSPP